MKNHSPEVAAIVAGFIAKGVQVDDAIIIEAMRIRSRIGQCLFDQEQAQDWEIDGEVGRLTAGAQRFLHPISLAKYNRKFRVKIPPPCKLPRA